MIRCVNLDWLEVYCLESNNEYPCNADYFRRQGYFVHEREYGTRQYKEMFTIVDVDNNPLIEIRRNPASGDSSFSGLLPQSTHIRLPNWMCYRSDAVDYLRNFLLRHDYIFKRIFRIDVCYDFEKFDTGDIPARFARRVLEKTYLKINQGRISVHGADNWSSYDWESLSWGSRTSMVSTKMYNKSKELAAGGHSKPYIYSSWFVCGLLDNPIQLTKKDAHGRLYKPEIWRIEFSMKSAADNWLIIEDTSGKRTKKRAVKHSLSLFDSPDKLWQRFQDLAYHYFRFKIKEYKQQPKGLMAIALDEGVRKSEGDLKRKDRMKDKVLFYWDKAHEFMKVNQVPPPEKMTRADNSLLKRLRELQATTSNLDIKKAAQVIIDMLEKKQIRLMTPNHIYKEMRVLQAAVNAKLGGDERNVLEIIAEIQRILDNDELY